MSGRINGLVKNPDGCGGGDLGRGRVDSDISVFQECWLDVSMGLQSERDSKTKEINRLHLQQAGGGRDTHTLVIRMAGVSKQEGLGDGGA